LSTINFDGSPCYSNSTDLAHRSIVDQESASPHMWVSLHAIWRACGEPRRKSPDEWVRMARIMIEGMNDYLEEAHMAFMESDECPWSRAPLVGEPISPARLVAMNETASMRVPYYRARDITAAPEVAELYAMFLDNRGYFECFVGGDPGGTRLDAHNPEDE
jgi:hypothetical protein